MASRRIKQVGYGTLYVIVWVLVIAAIYFSISQPAPSCFDHKQNQGETGVDCGGPCATVCVPSTLQTVSVLQNTQTFSTEPGRYTFLTQVANANTNFAVPNFSYTLSLYDPSNNLIETIPGTSYLFAGQVKYLLVPNYALVSTSSFTVDHATIAIGNVDWINSTSTGPVESPVPSFNNGNAPTYTGSTYSATSITVNGEITDTDLTSYANVLIVAVFKSDQGAVVGASQTQLDGITPNQTESFSVTYPLVPYLDPALTQFYAYAERP